jgi:hypothetical protein
MTFLSLSLFSAVTLSKLKQKTWANQWGCSAVRVGNTGPRVHALCIYIYIRINSDIGDKGGNIVIMNIISCYYIYSFIHSFIHSFNYSFICSFIYSCIHLFIHSFIHSFIYLFIHSFIRSFTVNFTYSEHGYSELPVIRNNLFWHELCPSLFNIKIYDYSKHGY